MNLAKKQNNYSEKVERQDGDRGKSRRVFREHSFTVPKDLAPVARLKSTIFANGKFVFRDWVLPILASCVW